MTAPTLRTVLKDYPHTQALKQGVVSSDAVRLEFIDVSPVHKAFAPMVRETAYDLSELAIVTALQAIAYGAPIVLLPAVVASRYQRGCLVGWAPSGTVDPASLAGRRVAVRAYTQTTGMWVRAHLNEDYGIEARAVEWLTQDPAHVAEFSDPPYVSHQPKDRALTDMLRDGDAVAAIFGNDLPTDPGFEPLTPDAAERDRAWGEKHGFMPINHMVAASGAACTAHPEAVRAAYRLLKASASHASPPGHGPAPYAFGFTALRAAVAYTIEACLRQDLLPRSLSVDEVFAPAMELLGHDGA